MALQKSQVFPDLEQEVGFSGCLTAVLSATSSTSRALCFFCPELFFLASKNIFGTIFRLRLQYFANESSNSVKFDVRGEHAR